MRKLTIYEAECSDALKRLYSLSELAEFVTSVLPLVPDPDNTVIRIEGPLSVQVIEQVDP